MGAGVETVYCELKYSGVGIAILLAASAASVALVLATPLGPGLHFALLAWIVAMACRALRSLTAPAALTLGRTRAIHLLERDGRWSAGELRDGSFVAPWLTIVRWRPEGARRDRTLILLPGMAPAGELRNIRVILRWS